MANSENGWPLVVEAQLEPLAWLPNNARLLAGPVAQVLGYVARQFAARVEPITSTSSFRPKATIGSGSTYSNHASGTALDMNGGRHPQGSKDTFTGPQVGAIRQILAECSGVLRWGGDYPMPITDEMHFEIRPGATAAQVAAAAAALTGTVPPTEKDWFDMVTLDDLRTVVRESNKQQNTLILRAAAGASEPASRADRGSRERSAGRRCRCRARRPA